MSERVRESYTYALVWCADNAIAPRGTRRAEEQAYLSIYVRTIDHDKETKPKKEWCVHTCAARAV